MKSWLSLRVIYPALSIFLVFLGPLFFYMTVLFLRKADYFASLLCFLAGWLLLRTGVDLSRAVLVFQSHPSAEGPTPENKASDFENPRL